MRTSIVPDGSPMIQPELSEFLDVSALVPMAVFLLWWVLGD